MSPAQRGALFSAAVVAAVTGGCTIGTEYVPRTPGRATVGMRGAEIGVYKNGAFMKMGDASAVFGCSAQATVTASASAERARSFRINSWIAAGSGELAVLSTLTRVAAIWGPAIGVGAVIYGVFGVRANNAQRASFALAVDAINLHNDTPVCLGAAPPVAGGQP